MWYNLKINGLVEVFQMSEINLDDYKCECDGKLKPFGRKSLKQYICVRCGNYITDFQLHKYKK